MASLQKGAKGKSVTKLQQLLNKAGARPRVVEDGDFGPATDAAVKAYQTQIGQKPTGKADKPVMDALNGRNKGPIWPVNPRSEMDATFAEVYGDSRRERHRVALAMKADCARLEARLAKLKTEIERQSQRYITSDDKLETLFPQFRKKLFEYLADREMFDKIRDVDPARAKKLAATATAKHDAALAVLHRMDEFRDRQNEANTAYHAAMKPLERL
ncbi:MAG: peptidoglycan-binding domain-containing protein [Pseudomonadota bacterium]